MIRRVLVLRQGDDPLNKRREEVRLGTMVRDASHFLVVEENDAVNVVLSLEPFLLRGFNQTLDRGEAGYEIIASGAENKFVGEATNCRRLSVEEGAGVRLVLVIKRSGNETWKGPKQVGHTHSSKS